MPRSALVNNLRDGLEFAQKIGFPSIVRPSFTLGGSGGGIAYNREELMEILSRGLDLSPVHECLIEESVLGWKEYELEVVRDLKDNVISSARSRTSIPWASTPATPSPSPPPRPSPTASTRPCATPPSPSFARSASRPAAPTSSSPSTLPTAA